MARKPKKRNLFLKHRQLLIVGCVLLLLAVGAYWLFWGRSSTDSTNTSGTSANGNKSGNSSTNNYVNTNPATPQEKQVSDNAKSAATQPSSTPTSADGKKQVTVVVSSGSSMPVHAYVTGVFEDNGTCTATATNTATSQTVSNTSAGSGNSNYTNCAPINLNLSSGTWTVVVCYSSSDATGSSQPVTVKV